MAESEPRLRVLGLTNGDHRRALSGVPGFLFDGLERTCADVTRVDYSTRGSRRIAVAARTFHPRRSRWVGRFYASRVAHRALTAALAERSRGHADYDVALQVHGWTHGQPRPFTLFADQTRLMADRGWPGWIPMPTRERGFLLAAERAMYAAAAHVFAMGKPTRDSLIADYGCDPSRITVTGGGLNFSEVPAPRELPAERSIVFIGRDFERKGGAVLLEAFRRVRRSVPQATLHIAGPRRRFSEAGVVGHGPINRLQLVALLRSARVFCMPSLYEPYGLAFAEAMAFGVPCVGSTAQSIPEILGLGEAGMLPPAGDPVALADAIGELLLDDELAIRLGEAGRVMVETVHTWDRVAQRMKRGLLAAMQPDGADVATAA